MEVNLNFLSIIYFLTTQFLFQVIEAYVSRSIFFNLTQPVIPPPPTTQLFMHSSLTSIIPPPSRPPSYHHHNFTLWFLENFMDPAHVPISHDRTDWSAKREDAQAMLFKVTERTARGFAGWWGREKDQSTPNFLRFDAPCVLQNNKEIVDDKGEKNYFSGLFLCRPSKQGKSMLIVRFGTTKRSPVAKLFPKWYFHQNAGKVFEQDMGFLSSQNEILMKEKVPTKDLYLNLISSVRIIMSHMTCRQLKEIKWADLISYSVN